MTDANIRALYGLKYNPFLPNLPAEALCLLEIVGEPASAQAGNKAALAECALMRVAPLSLIQSKELPRPRFRKR